MLSLLPSLHSSGNVTHLSLSLFFSSVYYIYLFNNSFISINYHLSNSITVTTQLYYYIIKVIGLLGLLKETFFFYAFIALSLSA